MSIIIVTNKKEIIMKGYTESETKELIALAVESQEKGISLSKVFKTYSEKCGKAKGSVRNYYYFLIKEAKESRYLQEKYPDIQKLTSNKNVGFTKAEEQNLLDAVNEGVMQGKSIRKTIMELSGGDSKLALRYQNKYRNLCKDMKPGKQFPKDKLLEELSGKINSLVEKIGKSLREENQKLAQKNQELRTENKKLKKQISLGIIEKYFEEDMNNKLVKKG